MIYYNTWRIPGCPKYKAQKTDGVLVPPPSVEKDSPLIHESCCGQPNTSPLVNISLSHNYGCLTYPCACPTLSVGISFSQYCISDYITKIRLFLDFAGGSALPLNFLHLLAVVLLFGLVGYSTPHRNLLAEHSDFKFPIRFLDSLDVVFFRYSSLRFHITKLINIDDFPIGVALAGQPENPPCHFKSVLGRVGRSFPP